MAKMVRGETDEFIESLKSALEEYEKQFSGSNASVYRQNAGSIRVRIVDSQFEGMSRPRRHDLVWEFLSNRVNGDVMSEISTLILLPVSELRSSLANLEFEDPTSSGL